MYIHPHIIYIYIYIYIHTYMHIPAGPYAQRSLRPSKHELTLKRNPHTTMRNIMHTNACPLHRKLLFT